MNEMGRVLECEHSQGNMENVGVMKARLDETGVLGKETDRRAKSMK